MRLQHDVYLMMVVVCVTHVAPMFDQCWPTVYDVSPTLVKHWVDVSCLLGIPTPVTMGNISIKQIDHDIPVVLATEETAAKGQRIYS